MEMLAFWEQLLRTSTASGLLVQMLGFNALAAAAVALPASLILARRQAHRWRVADYLFLCLFAATLPGIGPLLILPLMYPFALLGSGKPDPIPSKLDTPEYVPEITASPARFSAGGVVQRLQGQERQSAIQALMALSHRDQPGHARIIRELLRHQDDELRLLAFSILDRREKQIMEILHRIQAQMDQHLDPAHLALFQKELVLLYWELLNLAIGQEDLQQFYFEQTAFHLQLASELMPDDPGLQILRARLALRQNRTEVAERALRETERYPIPPSRTVPYLAELAFQQRRYDQVAAALARAPSLRWLPRLRPVLRLWQPG